MIEGLLARPSSQGVTHLITSITAENRASFAVFEGLARNWGAQIDRSPLFEREAHFAGAHATEWQVRIGPLPGSRTAQNDQEY